MNDINNIMSVLDTINKENTLSFYVPSVKRSVSFKGITTGQQKSLLETAVDNPVFQTRFVIATYNLIIENCLEKDIITQLTVIDRAAILVQYRSAVYGSEFIADQDNNK